MINPKVMRIGLPETGKIKIGMKGEFRQGRNGKFQLPTKLDHFLVTELDRDSKTGNFIVNKAIHKKIGEKPKSIPIRLLYNDIEANFQTRLACYNGKKVYCSGDGNKAMRATKKGNEPLDYKNKVEVDCTCKLIEPENTSRLKCKPSGKLSCMIDGINTIGGAFVLRTTSWNTIQSIIGSLTLIKSITGGELAGIPLKLTLQPKQVGTPDGAMQTAQIVSVIYEGSMESLREMALTQATDRVKAKIDIEHVEKKLLASIKDSDVNPEDEDYLAEFQPEQFAEDEEIPGLEDAGAATEKSDKVAPKKDAQKKEAGKKKATTNKSKKPAEKEPTKKEPEKADDAEFDDVTDLDDPGDQNIEQAANIEDDLDDNQEDPLLATPESSQEEPEDAHGNEPDPGGEAEGTPTAESGADDDDFDFDAD